MTLSALLITHDLSISGAPLSLLDLAKTLKQFGVHVSVASLRDGPLRQQFQACNIPIVEKIHRTDIIVFNTVLTAHIAEKLSHLNSFKIFWAHEHPNAYKLHPSLSYNDIKFGLFDSIWCVASFQARYLKKLAGNKVFFMPPFVEKPGSQPSHELKYFLTNNPNSINIRWVGRNEINKGIRELCRIASVLPSNFTLTTYGFYEDNETYNFLRTTLGTRYLSRGTIDRKQLTSETSFFDFNLCLSYIEVKPLSVLEAATLGITSLCTPNDAYTELSKEFNNVKITPLNKLYDTFFWTAISSEESINTPILTYSRESFQARVDGFLRAF